MPHKIVRKIWHVIAKKKRRPLTVIAPCVFVKVLFPESCLYKTLVEHRVGYFDEAGDIGAHNQVIGLAIFLGR